MYFKFEEPISLIKQSALTVVEDSKLTELFDKVLLLDCKSDLQVIEEGESVSSKPQVTKKEGGRTKKKSQTFDFRTLLTLCAQSISARDKITADDLLRQIRKQCTPLGDASQRLAYFFANALQARLEDDSRRCERRFGASRHRLWDPLRFPVAYVYTEYIKKQDRATEATDNGVEIPQNGFYPMQRIEDMCRRLTEYCKQFGVPFEYNTIASRNWETIRLEEFKIRPNKVLAVNTALRLKNVRDVTPGGEEDCPRDRFLKLIRDMKPDVFLSSTENPERIHLEGEFYRREVMKMIACERVDRVERPETYKQWQVRMMRDGFKQKPVEAELVESIRVKMKKWGYHKDFVLDEYSNWFLQGWKGRILFSSSCWIFS
ncbi:hypothetical protein IGI04_040370 [Brassica rapa subsp. trilocularis]|uniref:Uncharacterized protein n=1 Tax=Brassica rapa subsp. trilocularis TaxID=1813537 RepID=A0ABQ7KMP0_BRACM|nr:hypothetical protein IGI04_040370 [Brassica rapa subsp. trilocularis]